MRHSHESKLSIPFDLHVLGLPLAFILSQDQTLHCKYVCFLNILLLSPVTIVEFDFFSGYPSFSYFFLSFLLLNCEICQRTCLFFCFPFRRFFSCFFNRLPWLSGCKGKLLFHSCKRFSKKILFFISASAFRFLPFLFYLVKNVAF